MIMLERYFQYQAELSQKESHMQCPDDCSGPGCWMTEVIVETTLFDLIRFCQALQTPVSRLFIEHCYIGLENSDIDPRYMRLLIKMKKPCKFLQKARCRVHGSKPLTCVLFPEFHQLSGKLPDLIHNPIFSGFPCLKEKIIVSPARAEALKMLRQMSRQEEAVSNYFLFDTPSFIIDSKPLTKLLKQRRHNDRSYACEDYERLVSGVIKSTGFFNEMMGKIYQLDSRPAKERLYAKLEDDELLKSLLEKIDRSDAIYRLKGNVFIQRKRILRKPEVIYL